MFNFKQSPNNFRQLPSTHTRAFSLIETIVVLFIISTGLLGILSLIIQNIQSQDYNKNNLIAYQLAQEGIELARKARDSGWREAPKKPIWWKLPAGLYYMDYRDDAPHNYLSSQSAASLLKQDAQGFYFHDIASTATSSGFSRIITITAVNAHSVNVNSRVTWSERNRQASYDLNTVLYDWR